MRERLVHFVAVGYGFLCGKAYIVREVMAAVFGLAVMWGCIMGAGR